MKDRRVEFSPRGLRHGLSYGGLFSGVLLSGRSLADRYTTLRQVAETVAQLSGVAAPRITLPDPLVLLYAYLCEFWARLSGRPTVVTADGVKTLNERKAVSSAKAEEELGVSFRPLLETVSDEIAWFQRAGWV